MVVMNLDARLGKEQRENNITHAAWKPNGDKKDREHADKYQRREFSAGIHQDVERGGPRADQNVSGVGKPGSGQEKCDGNPQKGGGIDQVPVLDEAEMQPFTDAGSLGC